MATKRTHASCVKGAVFLAVIPVLSALLVATPSQATADVCGEVRIGDGSIPPPPDACENVLLVRPEGGAFEPSSRPLLGYGCVSLALPVGSWGFRLEAWRGHCQSWTALPYSRASGYTDGVATCNGTTCSGQFDRTFYSYRGSAKGKVRYTDGGIPPAGTVVTA
jgi:hypothetical protein